VVLVQRQWACWRQWPRWPANTNDIWTCSSRRQSTTRIGFIGDRSKDSGRPFLIVPVPGSVVDTDLIAEQNTGEIRTQAL